MGLVLLGLGTLLFLALISYTRDDVWFYRSPANHPAQNFIGPIGAIIAACFYFLLGAASYLVAAAMLGFGAAKLLSPSFRLGPRAPWVAAFVISGACLLHLAQPLFLKDWKQLMHIHGPGGWFGYWLGARVFNSPSARRLGDPAHLRLSHQPHHDHGHPAGAIDPGAGLAALEAARALPAIPPRARRRSRTAGTRGKTRRPRDEKNRACAQ